MNPLSPDQEEFVRRGRAAGYSDDDLASYLQNSWGHQVSAPGIEAGKFLSNVPRPATAIPLSPQEEINRMRYPSRGEQAKEIIQGGGLVGAGMLGGTVGSAIVPGFPAAGGRIGATVAGTGFDLLMDYLSGRKPDVLKSVIVGGAGPATEGALSLGARGAGLITSIPNKIISRTLREPTAAGRVNLIRAPGEFDQRNAGLAVLNEIDNRIGKLSPGRIAKVSDLEAADKAGVRIDLADFNDAVDKSRFANPKSPGERLANDRLEEFRQAVFAQHGVNTEPLMGSPRGPTAFVPSRRTATIRIPPGRPTMQKELAPVSPQEADEILQSARSYVKNAFSTENPTETQSAFRKVSGKIRESFYNAMDESGVGVRENSEAAKKYLDSIETLEQYTSEKNPHNFVDTVAKNEDARFALREFEKQIGSGGELESRLNDLFVKKTWSRQDTFVARTLVGLIEKIAARPLTRGLVISARPLGRVATGVAAYTSATQPQGTSQ